jgi:hypothetical protein
MNSLKVMYTNADSLLNKRDELRVLIVLHKPDIVCITKYLPNNFNAQPQPATSEFSIEGYECFVNENGNRGVIIYTANKLRANTAILPFITTFDEQTWISIGLSAKDTLLVGGIYRSPNSHLNNNEELLQLLRHFGEPEDFTHILICGDFKIPAINWNNPTVPTTAENPASYSAHFIESILDSFLWQHVSQPTHLRLTIPYSTCQKSANLGRVRQSSGGGEIPI